MASNPQGIYARLKTEMKDAYYTDNMVENLANLRTRASAYGLGPGQYKNLPFLEICENLEGKGIIRWNKLDNLKNIVKSASIGEMQLLEMINEAEREIQSLSAKGKPGTASIQMKKQLGNGNGNISINSAKYVQIGDRNTMVINKGAKTLRKEEKMEEDIPVINDASSLELTVQQQAVLVEPVAESLQTRDSPESTKRGISDIKEPLKIWSYPGSTKRGISDYKEPLQTRVFPESTKRGVSDIKEPLKIWSYPGSTKRGISDYKESLQTRDSPESTEREISDIKELPKTKDYPESTEREISDIKDLVPIDVWGRAPSQTEIEKIVTLIDSKFSDLFLELGLPSKTVEEYGQGHPVTFQLRMKALLQCWIDSSQTKATIGRLLTAMKLFQMDWHTAAQIWSAE